MPWIHNLPGDMPLVIIGAGFTLGLTSSSAPKTPDIIPNGITKFPGQFPALEFFKNRTNANLDLNSFWDGIEFIGATYEIYFDQILEQYLHSSIIPIQARDLLVGRIQNKTGRLSTLIGVELKRLLTYTYRSINPGKNDDLFEFFKSISKGKILSFNYDLVIERFLTVNSFSFEYVPRELQKNTASSLKMFEIFKPHGSINLWHETNWGELTHKVYLEDENDPLKACDIDLIGLSSSTEKRPFIIGYVSDQNKAEINSSGSFRDSAHDFCKANFSLSGLYISNCTSIYIIGYGLPKEDIWLWERIKNKMNKSINIYVCSGSFTQRIINELNLIGYRNVYALNPGNGNRI